MTNLVALQGWLSLALGIAALVLELFAAVDALRHPADAYPAAGKRTKGLWVGLTVGAALIGFLSVTSVLSLVGIAAVVVAAVYITDVRPALMRVRGRGRGGPYGPW